MVKVVHSFFCMLRAVSAASGQATSLLLPLEPVPPFPELRVAATAAGIPVDGMN